MSWRRMLLVLQVASVLVVGFFSARAAFASGSPEDCYIWIWKDQYGAYVHPDPGFRCTIGECDQPVVKECEYIEATMPGLVMASCECSSEYACKLVFTTNGTPGQSYGTAICMSKNCKPYCPPPMWTPDPFIQRAKNCICP